MSNRREWQPRLPTRRSGTTLDLLHGRREGPNQIKERQASDIGPRSHTLDSGKCTRKRRAWRGGRMPNEAPRMTSWVLLRGARRRQGTLHKPVAVGIGAEPWVACPKYLPAAFLASQYTNQAAV